MFVSCVIVGNDADDLANRTSVVIYSIDPRGLPTLSLTAADNVKARNPQAHAERMQQRRTDYFQSQDGYPVALFGGNDKLWVLFAQRDDIEDGLPTGVTVWREPPGWVFPPPPQ